MVAAKWDPKTNSNPGNHPVFNEEEVLEMLSEGLEPRVGVVRLRGGSGSDDDDDDDDEEDEDDDNEDDDENDNLEAEVDEVLEGNLEPDVKSAYRARQFEFVMFIHGEYVKAQREEEGLTQAARNKRNFTTTVSYFEKVVHPDFLEAIEEILGEDTTLEEAEQRSDNSSDEEEDMNYEREVKAVFNSWITDASRTIHEQENRSPPPLNLDKLSARTFDKWLVSLKRPDGHWWSKAYYTRRRSALFDLYRDSGAELSRSTNKSIGRCIAAINKKIMKQKQARGESLKEGKSPMSFELYQKLCQWFVEKGTKEAIFACCFLTLTWNLMCRSNNTVGVRREHIKLTSDSLGIMFAHVKTDKEGIASSYLRHVYANPKNWVICCHNALAMYLMTTPSERMNEGPLFPGSSQYCRFSLILKRTMEEHQSEMDEMNIKIEEIGVHSVCFAQHVLTLP